MEMMGSRDEGRRGRGGRREEEERRERETDGKVVEGLSRGKGGGGWDEEWRGVGAWNLRI